MPTTARRNDRTPRTNGAALPRAIAVVGLVLGITSGCNSDGPAVTMSPPQTGTIGVSLTPASMTVAPGGTSGAGITITRGGQVTAPVTLAASGVPAGVTLSFGPATVTVGMQSSLTVTVAAGTPPGTSEIVIVGSSGTLMSPPAKLTVRIP